MKVVRATARIDPERAPPFFNLLANSEAIEEARVIEVNTTFAGIETFLFAIHGDAEGFREAAEDTSGVESVTVSHVAEDLAYALLVMRPEDTPLYDTIHESGHPRGFVLRTPIVYRDGAMIGRAVGEPEDLQAVFEDTPEPIDLTIEEIGQFRGTLENTAATLSPRQREAIEVAHDLGYYDQPRGATHEDVAAALGCAPATASDHLQKAEAKLVAAALDEFGSA